MTGIWLIRQNRNNIDNGKVPFFLFFVPRCADALIFKKPNLIIGFHRIYSPFLHIWGK